MKPAPFAYRRPTELAEALALLAEHGDRAAVLAGGQSLVPQLAARRRRPALLVDINRVRELNQVRVDGRGVEVGATVRQRTLERHQTAGARVPLLAQALPLVGRVGTRNRGTVVGSIAFADPAAELPSVLMASGGEVSVRSAAGARMISADDLFAGPGRTVLAADELIVGVRFGAAAERTAHCWLEFGRRPGDLPLVGVAVSLGLDRGGRITSVSAVCAGAHDRPWRLSEQWGRGFTGQEPTARAFARLAREAAVSCAPVSDARTTSAHRRGLVESLLRRALHRCAGIREHTHAA